MSDEKAYKQLIDHQRGWLFGLPESELLMPMIEMRFTPDEAEFCSLLPHLPHTAEQLSLKLNMSIDEVTEGLDTLAKKGIVQRVEGKNEVRYALMDSMFWFYRMPGWKGAQTEWDRKLSTLQNQYYIDAMASAFLGHDTQGLRAIPINATVRNNHQIMPYEDIVQVIDQVEYYTVSTCACRHRKNLDPDSPTCRHETMNCLHFDKLGRYIVQNDLGKEITKEETLEILASAADAGLVHGISNTTTGMDTICNCCSCCCLFLESHVKMNEPVPRGHQRSNYILEHDNEKCKACGLCVTRCPMGAVEFSDRDYPFLHEQNGEANNTDLERKGKEYVFRPDKCLGCGVCVHKCPAQAISLKHRNDEFDFPEKMSDLGQRILEERGFDSIEVFRKNL